MSEIYHHGLEEDSAESLLDEVSKHLLLPTFAEES